MLLDLLKKAKRRFLVRASLRAQRRLAIQRPNTRVNPEEFADSLRDRDGYYLRYFQDFHQTLPPELRAHRAYFLDDFRGFGEDAFHAMWWRLARRFRPGQFLEIGVYRGQVISLISLLAEIEGFPCEVTGISPFSNHGDSVSVYRSDVDYLEDTFCHFRIHRLQKPNLVQSYSTDPAALAVIRSRAWDMIYIDGSHDYEVARQDWHACSAAVKPGGIIILDDAGLGTSYRPPRFATAGHPGPSRVAGEIDRSLFTEILQVGHNRVFQRNAL